jgi:hypothetical protein
MVTRRRRPVGSRFVLQPPARLLSALGAICFIRSVVLFRPGAAFDMETLLLCFGLQGRGCS